MKKALLVAVAIVAAVGFGRSSFASVSDDQVTSQKIREADGTSGQNTNSGSGVKTDHLQDAAVTTPKIADGAVTDAKIGGTLSQSKVTGLETDLAGKADVTHNHDMLYQQKYGKVAVVAQTGGDYANPLTAMNNVSSWCGSPGASNPCMVKIMPGIYNLNGNTLSMIPYVDIEGSGIGTTTITGSGQVVIQGAQAELRNITIESTATTDPYNSFIVSLGASATMTMSHVNLTSASVSGVMVSTGTFIATDSAILSAARALIFYSGNGTLNNVSVFSPLEVLSMGWNNVVKIINSSVNAPLRHEGSVPPESMSRMYLLNSQVGSVVSLGGAITKCVNLVDANYNPYICP